jgi:hypothetical protein
VTVELTTKIPKLILKTTGWTVTVKKIGMWQYNFLDRVSQIFLSLEIRLWQSRIFFGAAVRKLILEENFPRKFTKLIISKGIATSLCSYFEGGQ